jgi:predicted DNA-binding ribbon-helix-helix protein
MPKKNSIGAAIDGVLDDWTPVAAQKPKKRSLTISGHRTSISLEEPFWDGLKCAAQDKGVSVAALVAAIDAVRGEASLSSAIRLFVYERKEAGLAGNARA